MRSEAGESRDAQAAEVEREAPEAAQFFAGRRDAHIPQYLVDTCVMLSEISWSNGEWRYLQKVVKARIIALLQKVQAEAERKATVEQ